MFIFLDFAREKFNYRISVLRYSSLFFFWKDVSQKEFQYFARFFTPVWEMFDKLAHKTDETW